MGGVAGWEVPPRMHTNKQLKKLSVSQREKWYDVKKVDVNSCAKHSNAKKMVVVNRKRKQATQDEDATQDA
eukprot:COSAG02_NODE_5311_length_4447_cov_38.707452_4_plen_71_part_00